MNTGQAILVQVEGARGILVVDDDEHVLRFLSKMLSAFGFEEVYQASSVQQAFQIWETHRQKLRLVISDCIMPQSTGDIMVLRMLEDQPELKVLFISGNNPDTLGSKIPLRSGRNFLQKPFAMTELRQSIQGLSND
jgi:two-component system cell cycle sensor histidine kinase/response regulator CckA